MEVSQAVWLVSPIACWFKKILPQKRGSCLFLILLDGGETSILRLIICEAVRLRHFGRYRLTGIGCFP